MPPSSTGNPGECSEGICSSADSPGNVFNFHPMERFSPHIPPLIANKAAHNELQPLANTRCYLEANNRKKSTITEPTGVTTINGR